MIITRLADSLRRIKQLAVRLPAARALPTRSVEPYSTHIPVLVALAVAHRIHCVCEFGSGRYSTPLFLNRDIFCELHELVSFENDDTWFREVSTLVNDQRLRFEFVNGGLANVVDSRCLETKDLIFIDDGTKGVERQATIAAVASQRQSSGVVAIHDFEYAPYQQAASFRNVFIFDALNPFVGVASNGKLPTEVYRRLNNIIRLESCKLLNTDAVGWRQRFVAAMSDS
jgi:hypothetical protein